MSVRTFILKVDEKNKELVEEDDLINIFAIRILEVYLEESSAEKVSLEVVSSVKKFALENVKLKEGSYFINIDFGKDIVLK